MVRPDYIIRGECVTTALCKKDNLLFTGTEEGSVKVYDTEIMRPTSAWQAHEGNNNIILEQNNTMII